MKLVSWLKQKYQGRRAGRDQHDPWWVTLMLDVGRPLVAIMILVMCAPGEHYLMLEARFSDPFAWLGPATLTAYAGIAAVTATKRPKGSRGHRTAVTGAVLSIGLAMAAQPIAHLWGVPGLDLQRIVLVCVVSSVPSAVFGHLLHMGAVGTPDTGQPDADSRRTSDTTVVVGGQPDSRAGDTIETALSGMMSVPDTDTEPSWTITPKVSAPAVRRTADGSMTDTALSFLTDNPDATDADMKAAILDKFGADSKPDSVSKAVRRARAKAAA